MTIVLNELVTLFSPVLQAPMWRVFTFFCNVLKACKINFIKSIIINYKVNKCVNSHQFIIVIKVQGKFAFCAWQQWKYIFYWCECTYLAIKVFVTSSYSKACKQITISGCTCTSVWKISLYCKMPITLK